jgi:hypothetical protein
MSRTFQVGDKLTIRSEVIGTAPSSTFDTQILLPDGTKWWLRADLLAAAVVETPRPRKPLIWVRNGPNPTSAKGKSRYYFLKYICDIDKYAVEATNPSETFVPFDSVAAALRFTQATEDAQPDAAETTKPPEPWAEVKPPARLRWNNVHGLIVSTCGHYCIGESEWKWDLRLLGDSIGVYDDPTAAIARAQEHHDANATDTTTPAATAASKPIEHPITAPTTSIQDLLQRVAALEAKLAQLKAHMAACD